MLVFSFAVFLRILSRGKPSSSVVRCALIQRDTGSPVVVAIRGIIIVGGAGTSNGAIFEGKLRISPVLWFGWLSDSTMN